MSLALYHSLKLFTYFMLLQSDTAYKGANSF